MSVVTSVSVVTGVLVVTSVLVVTGVSVVTGVLVVTGVRRLIEPLLDDLRALPLGRLAPLLLPVM